MHAPVFLISSLCGCSVKHLWDEKPADWPENVPFKDPNNAIKDGM